MTSRVRVALAAAVVLAACTAPPRPADPTPTPTPTDPAAAPTAAPSPAPTTTTTRDTWAAPLAADEVADDVEQLRTALARLEDPPDAPLPATAATTRGELLVGLMRATAGRDRHGHTGVFPTAQRGLPMWPLQLYDLEDGWRVVDADGPLADVVGARVTAIGGVPPAEAATLVAPLVPRDNSASLRGRTPLWLVSPTVLAGVGLAPTIELDGEVLAPPTIEASAYAERFGLFSPLVCPPLPRPDLPTWGVREVEGAVVLRYGRVVRSVDGRTVDQLVDELVQALETSGATRLVLDVRDDPGGELPSAAPVVDAVRSFAAAHPGGLTVLAGRCTFSAAGLVVAELLADTDARLVGEPVGGAPELWADPRTHTLRRSDVTVHVAATRYAAGDPGQPALLEPDVAVPLTWADHEAGRDAALEAALAP